LSRLKGGEEKLLDDVPFVALIRFDVDVEVAVVVTGGDRFGRIGNAM